MKIGGGGGVSWVKEVFTSVTVVEWEDVFVSIRSSSLLIANRQYLFLDTKAPKRCLLLIVLFWEKYLVDGVLLMFASLSQLDVDQSK
ncbi:unnamed protein product [Macrosiphum euphorbiae]|uniref:Uncharacterized protein n=1 Tax=Macrosiphum euphorbiae TaxID=13131 RepID=A0AAV0XG71_9HEMI|nr:unnamed protein product [Macrosiphum euphorbiae]